MTMPGPSCAVTMNDKILTHTRLLHINCAYTNTYIHTYVHTVRKYILYVPMYIPYINTYVPMYIRTYICTYVRIYVHRYVYTYTHTHTYMVNCIPAVHVQTNSYAKMCIHASTMYINLFYTF